MIQLLPTIVGDTNHSSPSNFEAFEAIFNINNILCILIRHVVIVVSKTRGVNN